ncbi:unnamed protein product [Durusdinium trenchii]|uniref:TauD/TfdA-like domain-containing protein n=2 Tax=Durusdinium trenchii TaxID=1381693 RepID=A0ABP0PPD3_9DINO
MRTLTWTAVVVLAAANWEEECQSEEVDVWPEGFVVQISPKDGVALDSAWLRNWTQEKKECLKSAFFEHGVLLFRGFAIPDARAFEEVALAFVPNLEKAYLGTSPRSQINGTSYVFTAADFQPHRTVPVHIEMSFRDSPPATQLFYAQRVDQWRGGETPLTDFHQVWEQLRNDRRVGPHFEQQKVKYRRNMDDCSSTSQFDPLVQKCWQMMFKDEKDAKENCLEEGFHCSWDTSTNRLTLLNEQPFVRPHPITGQPIWYNHINVLHGQMMPGDYARTARLWDGPWSLWPTALSLYYRLLFNIYGLFVPEAEMGSTATKGSGEAFTTEELQAMKNAIHAHTVNHKYQANDIVMVDNHRVGHGREIYLGPKESRVIYTAWSNHYPPSWQNTCAAGAACHG